MRALLRQQFNINNRLGGFCERENGRMSGESNNEMKG